METIRDTYHVYLDSEASTQTGNTHYFPISPSIDVMYPQKGYIYLKILKSTFGKVGGRGDPKIS